MLWLQDRLKNETELKHLITLLEEKTLEDTKEIYEPILKGKIYKQKLF